MAEPAPPPFGFAVIGINHDHVHGLMQCMAEAGGVCRGFHAAEADLAAAFAAAYPDVPRAAEARQLLEAEDVALIVSAAIPGDRAAIAIAAMRHGRDVLVDKPGMVSFEELRAVRAVQAETGRIHAVFFSEHLAQRATVQAAELVAAGAIGAVVNLVGLGPHRIRAATRPDWFFRPERNGGILVDIASHQCEQFLFFAGAVRGEVLSATVGNHALPAHPAFRDFGDMHLRAGTVTGYARVDWYTPEALPVWGDGRLTILGTEGSIELRKYLDPAGRSGGDHLFLSNRDGVRHIDCSKADLPFGRLFAADMRDRTENAMPQARSFGAMELALTAQAMAERQPVPDWARAGGAA
ncbi:Gfo/Idh/MocA family oxidoreductase [Roseomonas sp. E05]|uniref:Gfo/Idh/MocA family protein n=1 Tax=Roseomonas sp. E05 TaxID=3046310 RepID=UPI0024BAC50B|nr:Gfo/Idh/MocA family oxidoreductase [Roseomonas sp. E05]MDJ0388850.1 Gfo/Idh/MocA family oxidoreductase [Roseomonas sp. E05]